MKRLPETHRHSASPNRSCPSIVLMMRIGAGETRGHHLIVDGADPSDDRIWRPEFAGEDVRTDVADEMRDDVTRPIHTLGLVTVAPPLGPDWGQRHADVELASASIAAGSRRRILRSVLIAIAIIAVGSVGVVIGRSSIDPTSATTPPAATTAQRAIRGSNVDTVTSRRRLTLPTSPVPPSPCQQFIAAAINAVDTDVESWIVNVISSGARLGQTLEEAIRDRLVTARVISLRSARSDSERARERSRFDSVISLAAEEPCTSP